MIDEIGKMECFSEEFNLIISTTLDSKKTLIATIALKGGGLIARIKQRTDIRLFEVRRNKQDALMTQILEWVNFIK
jgi:nucleoside-triphosphatase